MNIKKILCVLLAIVVILPIFATYVGADAEPLEPIELPDDSVDDGEVDDSDSREVDETTIGINYIFDDLIIQGKVKGEVSDDFFINLSLETITFPSDYKVAAYSLNGGGSWTTVGSKSTFGSAEFVKLLTKNFTLVITDKYNTKTKTPPADAVVATFARINQRPKITGFVMNYIIGADASGLTAGTWVLSVKNSNDSIKEGVDVAVAGTNSGIKTDENGFGRFYGKNGSINGIPVTELENNKIVPKSYIIRNSPVAHDDGSYTAASASKRFTAAGQKKPSSYSVNKSKKTITYSANTYVFKYNDDDKPVLMTVKGTVDVSDYEGDVYLWSAATTSATASAMQKTSITPGDKQISYINETVTTVPQKIIIPEISDTDITDILDILDILDLSGISTFGDVNILDEIYALIDKLEDKGYDREMFEMDLDYYKSYDGGLEELRDLLLFLLDDDNSGGFIDIMPLGVGFGFAQFFPSQPYSQTLNLDETRAINITYRLNDDDALIGNPVISVVPVTAADNGAVTATLGLIVDSGGLFTRSIDIKANRVTVDLVEVSILFETVGGFPETAKYYISVINPTPPPIPPPALVITTPFIPDAEVGTGYPPNSGGLSGFEADGGIETYDPVTLEWTHQVSAYKWELLIHGVVVNDGRLLKDATLVPGTPPSLSGGTFTGLTLTTGGAFSGTPQPGMDGEYDVTVRVIDGHGRTAEKSFAFKIWDRFIIKFGVGGGSGSITAQNKTDKGEVLRTETTHSSELDILIRMSSNIYFNATPDAGYRIKEWRVTNLVGGSYLPHIVVIEKNEPVLKEPSAVTASDIIYTYSEYNLIALTNTTSRVMVVFEPITPEITTVTLPKGKQNHPTAYNAPLAVRGIIGTAKWSWSLPNTGDPEYVAAEMAATTELPQGLAINPNNGAITGTPTKAGVYYVRILIEDLKPIDLTVRTSSYKYFKLVVLDQITITYEIDMVNGGQDGTIDASYEMPGRILRQQDGKTIVINAWEEDEIIFIAKPFSGYTVRPVANTSNGAGNEEGWISNPAANVGVMSNNTNFTEFRHTVGSISGNTALPPNPKTLSMKVIFTPQVNYYVWYSVQGGNGNVTATVDGNLYNPGDMVPAGKSVNITATPMSGYRVKSWIIAPAKAALPLIAGINGATVIGGASNPFKGGSYTVASPLVSTNSNVTVVVIFEPTGTASSMYIVREDGDSSVYLPDATRGVYYEFGFDVEGVVYNHAVWSISPASANGLTIDPDTGVLSGIPEPDTNGFIPITITAQVYMPTGLTDEPSKTFQIRIRPAVALVISPVIPDGLVGRIYSESIEYTGSRPSSWTETTSVLSTIGLTLDAATGRIYGTPTQDGIFTFEVEAVNAHAGSPFKKEITLSISIPAAPAVIMPDDLPEGSVGVPYRQTLMTNGSPADFTWSIISGSLPPELSLDTSTGEISGTPTVAGTYIFNISVGNIVGKIAQPKQYVLVIEETIINNAPPNGAIEARYSHVFSLNAVITPVEWSWTPANDTELPPGLDLNNTAGEIRGTPTAVGTYTFTVTAEYGEGFSTSRTFTITINDPPVIEMPDVLYGDVGVKFWEIIEFTGSPLLEWEWSGSIPPGLVMSDLNLSDPMLPPELVLSKNPRIQYGIISGVPTTAGFYTVTIKAISNRGTPNTSTGTKTVNIIIRGLTDVISITGVPNIATTNRDTLIDATVNPIDATNKSIIWRLATLGEIRDEINKTESIKLLTVADVMLKLGLIMPADPSSLTMYNTPPYNGLTLNNGMIKKTSAGTVWLRATINNGTGGGTQNYIEYFKIDFRGYVPVTNITGIPSDAVAGQPLSLAELAELHPRTATFTTIEWSIKHTDIAGGAALNNGVLTASGSGNVLVTATVRYGAAYISSTNYTDYTKDFLIRFSPAVPKVNVIEPQSVVPVAGKSGKAQYPVEVDFIKDGIYSIILVNAPSGITVNPTNIQIANGKGVLTVLTTASVAADIYPLMIVIDEVESNRFAFKVEPPPNPIPPSIIRPEERLDTEFITKEPGGSLGQLYLPTSSMNRQYNETLLTTGFEYENDAGSIVIPPLYWRIVGGTLPPGLKLTQWIEGSQSASVPTGSTGWDTGYSRSGCVIEGTPTETGVGKLYTFIAEADEILYYQRGTSVVWQKEGSNVRITPSNIQTWLTENPKYEVITWGTGNTMSVVVFSGKKATRTINILVSPTVYHPTTGLTLKWPGWTVTQNTLRLPVGDTNPLVAEIAPANASFDTVIWQTNNSRVATVDQMGNVYGISKGTAIITATTTDGKFKATKEVVVEYTSVTRVNTDKSSTANRPLTLTIGGTDILKPTVQPANATEKSVTFASSDLNVVTVDVNGKITAIGVGTAVITVTTTGVNSAGVNLTADYFIKVENAPPVRATEVHLNKTSVTMKVGETDKLTATVLPDKATNKTVTWKVSDSDSKLVSVDPVTGVITARASTLPAEPVKITAVVDQSGTPVEAYCWVDVEPQVFATGIALNKTMAVIPVRMTEMLTATIEPINTTLNSRYNLLWRSMDENIATVDSKGNVTGRAIGITRIEVGTPDGFFVEYCTIEVVPLDKEVPVFIDVDSTEWYYEYVNQAASYGLVQGIGDDMFAPERNVTRAEFVAMVVRALKLTSQGSLPTFFFADVNPNDWHYDYIKTALAEGLLDNLVPDEKFYPNRAIRREEMAVILAAAARSQGLSELIITADEPNITDDDKILSEYSDDVMLAYKLGLMNGFPDGSFSPQGVTIRAQAATVMVRLYHEIARAYPSGVNYFTK